MSTSVEKIKKGFIIPIAIAIVAIGGVFLFSSKPSYTSDIIVQRDYGEHIRNSTIEINKEDFGSVQFSGGQYSFRFFEGKGTGEPNTNAYLNMKMMILGDLNGDYYKPDAAVIFTEQRGGTGLNYKLGVVTFTEQGNKLIDWIDLGDRIDIKSLLITDGNIVIERSIEDYCGASCTSGKYKAEVYKIVNSSLQKVVSNNSISSITEAEQPVACTMDAMMCPDGSYVGRSGPKCEFVCPNKINSSQIETIIVASSINGNFVGDDTLVLTDDKGIKWTIKYNSATYYEENVFAKPSIWVSDFSNWLVSRKKILSSNYDGPGIPGAVKIIGLVDVNGILNASKIIQHVQ